MGNGSLGGVGDLYAILGAGAYLGVKLVSSGVGSKTPTCPVPGLDRLSQSVFREVFTDLEMEKRIFEYIENPDNTDNFWRLVEEYTRDGSKSSSSFPCYIFIDDINRYLSDAHQQFFNKPLISKLKKEYPFHTHDGKLYKKKLSFKEILVRGPRWWFFDIAEAEKNFLRQNRLVAVSFIMESLHYRFPEEIIRALIGNLSILNLIDGINWGTHREDSEAKIRARVEAAVGSEEPEDIKWLDKGWERIASMKKRNKPFYQLIHDHPVYSYRGKDLELIRDGNDGFNEYDVYPTCWDYVDVARPSLSNPVNREHFVLMLCATYKIVPKLVNWFEIFDIKCEKDRIIWQAYSKKGAIKNWIRGNEWQWKVMTEGEKANSLNAFYEQVSSLMKNEVDEGLL